MKIQIRTATLEDVAFLTDVVIKATLAQGRFDSSFNESEYRAGYEDWTRETILGNVPDCQLSVIEYEALSIGRLRVVRTNTSITLAGIQLLPEYQNQHIGTHLIEELKREAEQKDLPLGISVEKDNPNAKRLYVRLGFSLVSQDDQEYHLEYRSKSDL
jgi:ribosomal protein S18 acetylase RimI-like enzyme